MSQLTEFPDLAKAREQAAEWISRLGRGLDAAEQAEFRRWRASPANARALQELSALWRDLDVLKELTSVFPVPPTKAPLARARSWRPAIAAVLLLAMVGVGVLVQRQFLARQPAANTTPVTDYSTAVGEQRNVPLADGSVMAINTGSLVQVVSLGRQSRELRLVRGEAHFMVAHDPTRPFRVSAAGQVVQAVGTAFDVQLLEDGALEVVVSEGHVKLLSRDGAVGDLTRGQMMRISANGTAHVTQMDDDAIASRLAWRSGMLVFDGQTLAEVLTEFSRYTATRLVIADPALQQVRIGGYFAAGDIDALREALRANFGVESTRGADDVVYIGSRRNSAAAR
jgi:transmembrane sensor